MTEPEIILASVREISTTWYAAGTTGWVYRHYGPRSEVPRISFRVFERMVAPYDPIWIKADDGLFLTSYNMNPDGTLPLMGVPA